MLLCCAAMGAAQLHQMADPLPCACKQLMITALDHCSAWLIYFVYLSSYTLACELH